MDHQEAGLSHMVRPSWGHRSLDPANRLLLRCARLDLDDRTRVEVEAIVHGGVEWDVIPERSREEGTHALLYAHLNGLEPVKRQVPTAILARLGRSYQGNWARNTVLTHRWAELMTLLGHEGVGVITLKGMALIHTVYPEVALRPMADIDLLIQAADLSTVEPALRAAGYRTPGGAMEGNEAFRGYLHFVRDATVIDLHWKLGHYTPLEGIVRIDHDGLWKRSHRLAIGDAEGLMLCPEDLLLHLALHLTLASDFGRLIWFTDIDAMLRRYEVGFDWEAVLEEATRWRVKPLLGYVLQVCQRSFATPIPPGVLTRLLAAGLRHRLLDACIGTTYPPSLFGQLADSKIYLGQALSMERLRDVFRILWNSLLPSRTWVRFHYGLTWRWQIAVYQVLHPFRVLYLAVKYLR